MVHFDNVVEFKALWNPIKPITTPFLFGHAKYMYCQTTQNLLSEVL